MKRTTKCIIAVTLLIAIVSSAAIHFSAVSLFASDGYYYSIDTPTNASVYGRYVDDADVVIEREFSDHFITEIVANAFAEDTNAYSLDLTKAELLEKIGNYAFYNCSNLSGTVVFSGRMNSLGLSAFQGCSLLEAALFYANGVTLIPEQCFYQCSSLSQVILPDKLQRIDKLAFANCSSLTEVTIPSTVSFISPSAFDGCTDLTIRCYTGSYAQQYAEENGIEYVLIDTPEPPPVTEPPTEAPETEPPTVAPETETPTQEPETQAPETQPAQGYYLGDMDANGAVESLDVTCILRYLAQLAYPDACQSAYADVDGDGVLTILDATLIQRYLAEMTVAYPIGEWVAV